MIETKIIDKATFLNNYKNQFVALFGQCFGSSEKESIRFFNKYLDYEKGYFCVAHEAGKIHALYSVVEGSLQNKKVGLSINTMSNGNFKNATKILGEKLYTYLNDIGYYAVCGFPNKNIMEIRKNKLGWKITSVLKVYFCCFKTANITADDSGTHLSVFRRSASDYHKKKIFGVKLLSKRDLVQQPCRGPFLYATNQSSEDRPGFNLGKRYYKYFGYLALKNDDEMIQNLDRNLVALDFDSIDVP